MRVSNSEGDNPLIYSVLIFCVTTDGGTTWTARLDAVPFEHSEFEADFEVVSFDCIFVRGGANLYFSRDGAQSWQLIKPDIDFGLQGTKRVVSQIDFVDSINGWLVISDNTNFYPYGNYALYKTTDGGKTWAKLTVKIAR